MIDGNGIGINLIFDGVGMMMMLNIFNNLFISMNVVDVVCVVLWGGLMINFFF